MGAGHMTGLLFWQVEGLMVRLASERGADSVARDWLTKSLTCREQRMH